MRRPSNPSNEGTTTNELLPRAASAPNEPRADPAGSRERDRPQRVGRDGSVESVERAHGACRRCGDPDERLRSGLRRRAAVRGRGARAGGRRRRARAGRRGGPSAAPLLRPLLNRGGWLARDHGRSVGAAAVGVLDRRHGPRVRQLGGGKEQRRGRSGDEWPHAAEPSSWAGGRPAPRVGGRCKLRRLRRRAAARSARAAQRSSSANGTTFPWRSAARSST